MHVEAADAGAGTTGSSATAHSVWVDAILGAIAAGWTVLVAVLVYVGVHADDPGLPLLLMMLSIGVGVVGMVVLVLRALLQQAAMLRTDLEAVI